MKLGAESDVPERGKTNIVGCETKKGSDERCISSIQNNSSPCSDNCGRGTHIAVLHRVCSHNVTCFRTRPSESDREQKRAEEQKIPR